MENEKFNQGLKEEVSSFVSNLQKLLPKKKELIHLIRPRSKLTRLSDVHFEAKSVFPTCFVGARVMVMRTLMDKVKLSQQYNYGSSHETHKTFSHLLSKELESKDVSNGLVIDSSKSATATYTEVLEGGYDFRLKSKIKDLVSSETEVVVEKQHENSVSFFACSVRDMEPSSMKVVTQYMYKMTPEISCGSEVSFHPLKYPPLPDVSLSARYQKASFALSSTLSQAGFQMCLFKQCSPDLRISTILHESGRAEKATIGIALHKNYKNGSEMKVFVDTQQCGGLTFQKDVFFNQPSNEVHVVRLLTSILVDRQRRVRFGLGFHLDF